MVTIVLFWLKLVLAMMAVIVVTGCNQSISAQSQTDLVKLRMAATILEYVSRCENRSAPQHYVDKATQIWKSATEAERADTSSTIQGLVAKTPSNELCPVLGMGARAIIAWDFQVPEKYPTKSAPKPKPTGLSAKITRIEDRNGGWGYPLIVVENKSDISYEMTQWSCTFYSADEPVGEDSFHVKQVMANAKTAHRSITRLPSQPFDSTACRLIDARESD
jgi:hypothetical protein